MTGPTEYPFLKGHGTENDFVLLPDHDASVHGALDPQRVARLCDRRAGLGADGVIRVVRTAALAAVDPDAAALGGDAEWFMDYRNADGSVSEMCGNGLRVLARHLADEGLVDPSAPVVIGTRAGVKDVSYDAGSGTVTLGMGPTTVLGESEVGVGSATGEQWWTATHVDVGNPHAVAFVASLDDAGPLTEAPRHDASVYPHGVNVEFVVDRGVRHVAMRVHERGSGETRSCGTGACAVMAAAAVRDGLGAADAPPAEPVTYRVDVPGGELAVTWCPDGTTLLTGPAVVVARGTTAL